MTLVQRKPLVLADWQEDIEAIDRPDPYWRWWALQLAKLRFTVVKCVTDEDFYNGLIRHDPAPGQEVHVYSHGGPGRVVVGHKDLDENHKAWGRLRGSIVWFRSCDVVRGEAGQDFAEVLSRRHGIGVAGHLAKVGALGHSYLVGVRAGQQPWWPKGFDGAHSGPFAPRTVAPWSMHLPTWAFDNGDKKPLV